MEGGLCEVLLGEVNHQLEAKHIIITEGRTNIIDATPVEAAQSGYGKGANDEPTRDKDAGWYVKANSRGNIKSTYGYSVHTGVNEDGFTHRQTVTPGNAHDITERDTLLLGDEAALYADAAYSSQATREKLEQIGIDDQLQRKAYRGHPLSKADLVNNKEIAVIHSGSERPFTTYKSRYGLAQTRLMGLVKNLTLFGLSAIAHNISKGSKLLALFALSDPEPTG